jgi:hypothetical protein
MVLKKQWIVEEVESEEQRLSLLIIVLQLLLHFFYSILAAAELAAITLFIYLHILMLNRNTIFYFNVVLKYIY